MYQGMMLADLIQSLKDAEWTSREQFLDLLDIYSADLYGTLVGSYDFIDYTPAEIQRAIFEEVEEVIDVDYYKHQ